MLIGSAHSAQKETKTYVSCNVKRKFRSIILKTPGSNRQKFIVMSLPTFLLTNLNASPYAISHSSTNKLKGSITSQLKPRLGWMDWNGLVTKEVRINSNESAAIWCNRKSHFNQPTLLKLTIRGCWTKRSIIIVIYRSRVSIAEDLELCTARSENLRLDRTIEELFGQMVIFWS